MKIIRRYADNAHDKPEDINHRCYNSRLVMRRSVNQRTVWSSHLMVAGAFTLICFGTSHSTYRTPFGQPVILQNAQPENAPIFRLFKLEGTYSEELAANSKSPTKQNVPGFSVVSARLENDGMGALAKLRSTLTITNEDSRRITEVEWRLDIFDASIGNANRSVVQSEKKNIYSGETANVSARFGAVLPDRMVILLQVTRVAFVEGPSWSPSMECLLESNL